MVTSAAGQGSGEAMPMAQAESNEAAPLEIVPTVGIEPAGTVLDAARPPTIAADGSDDASLGSGPVSLLGDQRDTDRGEPAPAIPFGVVQPRRVEPGEPAAALADTGGDAAQAQPLSSAGPSSVLVTVGLLGERPLLSSPGPDRSGTGPWPSSPGIDGGAPAGSPTGAPPAVQRSAAVGPAASSFGGPTMAPPAGTGASITPFTAMSFEPFASRPSAAPSASFAAPSGAWAETAAAASSGTGPTTTQRSPRTAAAAVQRQSAPSSPPSGAPLVDAGRVAVESGLGRQAADGSIVFGPPADEAGSAEPADRSDSLTELDLQRAGDGGTGTAAAGSGPAPSPNAAAGPAAPGAGPVDLDELARRLYPRIRGELRQELRLDRERAGLLADFRR